MTENGIFKGGSLENGVDGKQNDDQLATNSHFSTSTLSHSGYATLSEAKEQELTKMRYIYI